MNKVEIIAALAAETGATKSDTAKFLSAFFNVIQRTLKTNEEIRLIGFGSFKVRYVAAKVVKNPQTGSKVDVPASKKVKFVPGKHLRDFVNSRG